MQRVLRTAYTEENQMKGKRLLAVTLAALTTVGLTFAAAACSETSDQANASQESESSLGEQKETGSL